VTTPATGARGASSDYLNALMSKDEARAAEVVETALARGMPVLDVYLEVLQPALYELGHLWAMERATVADEHFATAVTHRVLGVIGARVRQQPKDGRLAVVTSTPGELHWLGVQVVRDFLEADGWEVLCLGADTPAEDLRLLLSTSTAGRLPLVEEVLAGLARVRPRPLVVVGGQFWTSEASKEAVRMGADLVVRDPRDLVAVLRERFPPPPD
jgi:B12 binding protein